MGKENTRYRFSLFSTINTGFGSKNQLNITEIAYMVSYSERRYFSDDFKKKFGQSPKEYLEKCKNNELT